jgi:hypothetical protein
MKKKINLFALLLPLGMLLFLLQGCYTQFATYREEDPSYNKEEGSYSQQDDSTSYGESENWQPRQDIGFSYYYPSWSSYRVWGDGCIYPSYWDPWFWGSAFYVGYSYYPHYWGYYPRNNYWGYNHQYNGHLYAGRNTGLHRGSSLWGTYGNVGGNSIRGSITAPINSTGTTLQAGSYRTGRSSQNAAGGVSSNRQTGGNRYNPSIQQPRHRDQGGTTGRSSRVGSSRGRAYYGNQGSSSGQVRSSGRSSAPSYTPQPSTRSSSAPSSPAPAPRSDGGGGRQSGSGRSGR